MLILGLDGAQRAGWALYDTKANVNTIQFGTCDIRDKREKGEFELMAGDLAIEFRSLVKKIGLPDYAIIEKAPRQQYGGEDKEIEVMGVGTGEFKRTGPGLQGILSTNQMVASLCAVLACFDIPYETVMPSMWRKRAYGFGTHKGWTKKEWKRHAREQCARVRLSVKNDDEAEAVWIAFGGQHSQRVKYMEAQQQGALL